MRRVAAIFIALAALALLGVALVPDLHAFLSRGAGHSVTWGYVSDFRQRAIVCGIVTLLIAFAAWRFRLECGNASCRSHSARAATGVAALQMIIGAAIRIAFLPLPPRYDEAFTVTEFVMRSPANFLIHYRFANNHVFHTLLAWLVRVITGPQMWAMRLPAFGAGLGVLAATYALARRLKDEKTALVATALAAVASPLVEYSAQARGYTLVTLAFLLMFLFASELLAAIALALGAWTVPTMIYAAGAWALAQKSWRRAVTVGVAGAAMAFLLYAPMIVTSGVATFTESGITRPVGLPQFPRALGTMLADLWTSWNVSFPLPVAIVIALAALVAILRRTPAAMPLLMAIAAIAPMMIVLRRVPYARVFLFVLPLYLIAAASALADVMPDRFRQVILVVATLLLGWNTIRSIHRWSFYEDPAMGDVPAIAKWIRALPPDARVLVSTPLDAPYRLYAGARIIEDRFDSDPAAVRAAIVAAPRRYFVASTSAYGMEKFDALHLPYEARAIARYPHSVVFELRPRTTQAGDALPGRHGRELVIALHRGRAVEVELLRLRGVPEMHDRQVAEARGAARLGALPEFEILAAPADEALVEAADGLVGDAGDGDAAAAQILDH